MKTKKKSKSLNAKSSKPAEVKSAKGDGKSLGLKTGYNVSTFWNRILKANAKDKLTDAQLLAAFQAEFPKRTPQPMGRIRSFYNRGISGLGDGEGVRAKVQSEAYDKKGNVTKSDWTPIHAPDPKKAKAAKERALKGWKKKNRKPRVDSVKGVAHVAAGKKKAAKIKAKKGFKFSEKNPPKPDPKSKKVATPAGKTKKAVKLKVGKKKPA